MFVKRSDGELLCCPGNKVGHGNSPNVVVLIRISTHCRLVFDTPECENTIDSDVGLFLAKGSAG